MFRLKTFAGWAAVLFFFPPWTAQSDVLGRQIPQIRPNCPNIGLPCGEPPVEYLEYHNKVAGRVERSPLEVYEVEEPTIFREAPTIKGWDTGKPGEGPLSGEAGGPPEDREAEVPPPVEEFPSGEKVEIPSPPAIDDEAAPETFDTSTELPQAEDEIPANLPLYVCVSGSGVAVALTDGSKMNLPEPCPEVPDAEVVTDLHGKLRLLHDRYSDSGRLETLSEMRELVIDTAIPEMKKGIHQNTAYILQEVEGKRRSQTLQLESLSLDQIAPEGILKSQVAANVGGVVLIATNAAGIQGGGGCSLITVNATLGEANADGNCSLREAINAANMNAAVDGCTAGEAAPAVDVVVLPAGTITLTTGGPDDLNTSGDLDIMGSVVVNGDAGGTTIDTTDIIERVIDIDPSLAGIDVTLNRVNLINGREDAAFGGALRKRGAGTLTLQNCTVSESRAGTGGGLSLEGGTTQILDSSIRGNQGLASCGGIVHGDGAVLIIRDSTISGNAAQGGDGGGICQSGTPGSLTIVNSTISGNRATGAGGGLWLRPDDSVALRNVTVTNNTADSDSNEGAGENGGGIDLNNVGVGNPTTVFNSIIAGNRDDSDPLTTLRNDCSLLGDITSSYNMIGDDTGCEGLFDGTGDLVDVDPLLAVLASNGGVTQTHLLQSGSPAIDAGDPAGCTDENGDPLTNDQRGFIRLADGTGDGTARCDIGAVEVGCGESCVAEEEAGTNDVTDETPGETANRPSDEPSDSPLDGPSDGSVDEAVDEASSGTSGGCSLVR